MKCHLDKIWYWPIWTVSDIKATHNYRSGSYRNTALSLSLDGKRESFSLSRKSAYEQLNVKLEVYDKTFRTAVSSKNIRYIEDNDYFPKQKLRPNNETKKLIQPYSLAIYFLFLAFSTIFFGSTYMLNQGSPLISSYKNNKQTSTSYKNNKQTHSRNPIRHPDYVRPQTDPNGAVWPTKPSYLANFRKLNTGGLSTVTVDNSKNDSDVFVKLVSIQATDAFPVRVFYISAFKKFNVSRVSAGFYDIRYRDLATGGLARSESFALEETSTRNGTRYSDRTINLYKVGYGSIQTYDLTERDFYTE